MNSIKNIYIIIVKNIVRINIKTTMAFSKKIPDRWEMYNSVGKPIPGTRFIAFKVPLKETLCTSLPVELRFTPSDLLEQTKQCGINLGLVIDLTNTKRYYNPEVFRDAGLEYKKIFTEGKVVPSPDVKMRFLATVDEFIERNTDKSVMVGVHCTHGLNRTGHLVCRYMIDRLNMEPDEAIQLYNESRGHEMERENYIEDLRTCPTDLENYEQFREAFIAGEVPEQNLPHNRNHRSFHHHRETGYGHQPGRYANNLQPEDRNFKYTRNNKRERDESDWRLKDDRSSLQHTGPGSGWSLQNEDHKRGKGSEQSLPYDRPPYHQKGPGSGWNSRDDRQFHQRKGPGSGWSLPDDRQDHHPGGPGSGWSLPDDGQVHHSRGPGSGWNLPNDEHRGNRSNFSNDRYGRNRRGRGSGWSLPDDREMGQRQDSRHFNREEASSEYRGHNEGYGKSHRGRSRGRGHYNNQIESSSRHMDRSKYHVDRVDNKPSEVTRHRSGRGTPEEIESK